MFCFWPWGMRDRRSPTRDWIGIPVLEGRVKHWTTREALPLILKTPTYMIGISNPFWASQVALVVQNPHANAQDIRETGLIPGKGHGSPFQYSCLDNPHGQRSLAGCSSCKPILQREEISLKEKTSSLECETGPRACFLCFFLSGAQLQWEVCVERF